MAADGCQTLHFSATVVSVPFRSVPFRSVPFLERPGFSSIPITVTPDRLNRTMNDSTASMEDLVRATVWTPEQQVRELKRRVINLPVAEGPLSPRPTDVIVNTPLKCGTTWLTHIVHQLRMKGLEPDFEDQYEVMTCIERSELFGVDPNTMRQPAEPRLFSCHLPYDCVPKGGKMIYCYRDQEDALYSLHKFYDSFLLLRGRVSLPIFANTMMKSGYYVGDVAMVLNGLLVWWEHRNDDDVLFLFFDDLKEDHDGCVNRIAQFIGIDCDEALLARVVHTTTHAEMVRHHSKFDAHNVTTKIAKMFGEEPPSEFSGKVRKDGGQSGDGQKLPPEVRQYIKEKWQEIVTAKLGFQNLKEMRDAWHKEQKQKVKSL